MPTVCRGHFKSGLYYIHINCYKGGIIYESQYTDAKLRDREIE